VRRGRDRVVGLAQGTGFAAAVMLEVVAVRSVDLGDVSTADLDGVVVLGGLAVGALSMSVLSDGISNVGSPTV